MVGAAATSPVAEAAASLLVPCGKRLWTSRRLHSCAELADGFADGGFAIHTDAASLVPAPTDSLNDTSHEGLRTLGVSKRRCWKYDRRPLPNDRAILRYAGVSKN